MLLRFLGTGSGFADEHTSAYFTTNKNELVLIDCSMLNIPKLKTMNLFLYDSFVVLVTHTHGDHCSGLGLWIQYVHFVENKEITIIAPSKKVKKDLLYLLENLEGCDSSWYKLFSVDEVNEPWLYKSIQTEHSPQLAGKCFGYQLNLRGKNIIYTGDTATLEPFKSFLSPGSELYVDVSVNNSPVHLKLENILSNLIDLTKKDIYVYLMHLDKIKPAVEMVANIPNITVV